MSVAIEEKEVPSALSWGDIAKRNYKTLEFEGEWLEHLGEPELSGSWITWGLSGNGKTAYEMQLAKYMTGFTKVHYSPLEECKKIAGSKVKVGKSFKMAMERANMSSVVKGKFGVYPESYDELVKRLEKARSANYIVIDSLQYFFRGMTIKHYFDLLDYFPNKLFHFISHAQGNSPKGKLADSIRYHSDIKIHVKDFVAEIYANRFGGGKPHVIWEKGMRERELKLIKQGK
ncbi:MAG: hypothetical protein N4A74_21610 [Carboxylicivirga sp.]|jgi:hypothetical protein|nr:hypothetical protein [Carboxylicivirga sp.]